MNLSDKKAIIIYGPTATGKTALAIKLAKKYNGELICADSRQVYKGLDIGTGKLSIEQFNNSTIQQFEGYWIVDGIKIHGFDLVNPGDPFTVVDFLKFSRATMIQIIGANKLPIVVGGTGFYIKALIDGIGSIGIKPDQKLRRKLEKLNTSDLYHKLLEIDADRVKKMNESDRVNPRRLIRAIEIAMASTSEESEPTSEVNTNYRLPTTNYLLLGLTAPNQYLYQRADDWLDVRLAHGLIDEVRRLLDQKVNPRWLDDLGLEYRWVSRYLKKEVDYNQMVERLKGDIHSFVRRQKTWFNKFKDIKLFDISKPDWQKDLEGKIKSTPPRGSQSPPPR